MSPFGAANLDDGERVARLEEQVKSLRERVTWLEQSSEVRISGLEKTFQLSMVALKDNVTDKLEAITKELKPFKWLNYLLAGALLMWAFSSMFTPHPRPGSPPPAYAPKGP